MKIQVDQTKMVENTFHPKIDKNSDLMHYKKMDKIIRDASNGAIETNVDQ